MIITFTWPSSGQFGGGVAALYEYANGLARRGHEVHLVHGPRTPDRICSLTQLDWFTFDPALTHHIVDSLDDVDLAGSDVCIGSGERTRLGEPVVLIQGYKMISAAWERTAFRARCPKLCVATWLCDIGEAWGSPPEQMLHVPLGFDHDVFRPGPPHHERPVDVAMLYSIHPVKGGDDGLAALREVHRRRPDLRVELFGIFRPDEDTPKWATYRTEPSQRDLANEVYGRARVFVQPSRREGFGLTAVEAMACGCALVTTDNGGSRDYAVDDETALVVPPRDPTALADAIDALLADQARRTRLAAAGQRATRPLDWDHAAAVLEAHLERYVADPAHYQAPPCEAPLFLDDTW